MPKQQQRTTPSPVRTSPRDVNSPDLRTPAKKKAKTGKSSVKAKSTTSSSASSSIPSDGATIAGSPASTGTGGSRPAGDSPQPVGTSALADGTDDPSSVALALVDSVEGDDSLKELLRKLIADKEQMQSSLQTLQDKLTEAETKADRREQLRAYEEGAPTGFSHDREVLRKGFMSLIFKHLTDQVARDYWEQVDWESAPREEVSRAFSLLVKMLKSSRTSAFLSFLVLCLLATCSCTSLSRRRRTRHWWSGILAWLLHFKWLFILCLHQSRCMICMRSLNRWTQNNWSRLTSMCSMLLTLFCSSFSSSSVSI